MAITKSTRNLTAGISCSFTVDTSSYTTIETVPANGALTQFEIKLTTGGAGSANPYAIRIMNSLVSCSCGFSYTTTTFTNKASSYRFNLTKQAHSFQVQAKQSTGSTTIVSSIKLKWLSLKHS
jgi:hypothetical protein